MAYQDNKTQNSGKNAASHQNQTPTNIQRKGKSLMPPNAQKALQLKAMVDSHFQSQIAQRNALQNQLLNSAEGQKVQQLKAQIANSPQMQRAAQLQAMANRYTAQQQTPVQRMGKEEELLQGKFKSPMQRMGKEEEMLQGKFKPPVQRMGKEEEMLQGKFKSPVQRMGKKEEMLQGKFEQTPIQKQESSQFSPNNTGLPDNLKSGIENLSGYSMDDVKVHYNSDKPAQLQAHAYAQGTDIHLGSGQEKHLPHEAWHVVQQKQGRVKPTMQMKGDGTVNINDDRGLEREADVMGGKAMQMKPKENKRRVVTNAVAQKKSATKSAFHFVDNRPEAIQMRKLQEMANNYTQNKTLQLVDNRPEPLVQRMQESSADKLDAINQSSNTVQRVIDTSSFLKTQNGQYMVDSRQGRNLFSKENAKAPIPTGLYDMFTEEERHTGETIKVWTPNVKFLSKKQQLFMAKAKSTKAGKFTTSGLFGEKTLDLTKEMKDVALIRTGEGILPATTGAFGKNDCNLFASRLQNMIAHEKMTSKGGGHSDEATRNIDTNTATKKDLEVGVGDKMLHNYPPTEECQYHAATIVAKDGKSTVTLEAHVSKNLKHPQFHIRNGVEGFVEDNDTKTVSHFWGPDTKKSRGLGGNVTITPLGSVGDPSRKKEKADQRYRIMTGQEEGFPVSGLGGSTHFMQNDLGTVDRDTPFLKKIATEIAKEIGQMYGGWNKKQIEKFASSPEGKQKARIRISNMKKPTPSYIA